MWSKAAPKKAAANKAEKKRPAANAGRLGAVDAGAALDMAQQVRGPPHLMLLAFKDRVSLPQMDTYGWSFVLA